MSAFDAYVQARFHGGVMAGGPTFTVVHDAETPLRAGYCDSIVEFFRVGPTAGTSAHAMVDPVKAVKMLPDDVVAYAAGAKANPRGWHLEQAGYAKFKRADWTTADGMAQMRRAGACLREVHDTWSIPKRWCTDDQLRRAALGDRASGGMTTHQQVSRVIGGTTHTDPETNYPGDLLLAVLLSGDDDMAGLGNVDMEQQRDLIYDALWPEPRTGSPFRYRGELLDLTRAAEKRTAELLARIGPGPDNGLADLWNQGGTILAAIAGLSGQLDALVDQLDAIRSAGGAGGPSAEQIAAAVVRLQDAAARDGDPATGPVS